MRWSRPTFFHVLLWLLFFVSFGYSLPHVAPHITSGDSGELALAGRTLGVAHSPGYPVFTMTYKLGTDMLPFGNPAYRQNALSCLILCAALVLLANLFLYTFHSPWVMFVPFFLLGSPVFREASVVTEVFPLLFLGAVFTWSVAARYRKHPKIFYLAAYLMGLCLTIHQTMVLMIPALYFLLRSKMGRNRVVLAGLFFVLGFSINLYLPIRSFRNPVLDWEDPETLDRLWGVLTRARYGFFQLTQGQQTPLLSLNQMKNVFVFSIHMLIENLGIIGALLLVIGTFTSLARREGRRSLIACWLFLLFTGPFFFLLARVSGTGENEIFHRFGLLPLVPLSMLIAAGVAYLASSKVRGYRWLLAAFAVFFFVERSESHVLTNRWSLTVREAGINVLRHLPDQAVLISDRADEMEFSLAYLLFAEARKPGVRFLDGNAAVTPNIYGENYHRIWGEPRLQRRQRVEQELVERSTIPVYYATLDPAMIDVYRAPEGMLFRAWKFSAVTETMGFPWDSVLLWQSRPLKERSRSLMRANANLLARYLFDRGFRNSALDCFGLEQVMGGTNRFEQIGYWCYARGQLKDAREAYYEAIRSGARSLSLFSNLAVFESELGNHSQARALYRQGLELYPNAAGLLFNAVTIEWKSSNWTEAVSLLERILSIDPTHAEARKLLPEAKRRAARA